MPLPDSMTYPKPTGQERPYPKLTKTGSAPFKIPNHELQGETAYEIYGDLDSGKVPLIAVHGGPCIPHSYLPPLSLIQIDYGIPVIMYDQIGCGDSTHFPDRIDDTSLWNLELWMAELHNLKQGTWNSEVRPLRPKLWWHASGTVPNNDRAAGFVKAHYQ